MYVQEKRRKREYHAVYSARFTTFDKPMRVMRVRRRPDKFECRVQNFVTRSSLVVSYERRNRRLAGGISSSSSEGRARCINETRIRRVLAA